MSSTNPVTPVLSKRSPGNQARILVVDDDARLRELLKRFLTESGFAVYVAASAVEMNRFWVRERFDLLVLDLMLPGEDGISICQRLRNGGDQTPIIMLTAKGEDGDRIAGLHSPDRGSRCKRLRNAHDSQSGTQQRLGGQLRG